LMCGVGDRLVAVPLVRVVETMRPLPVRAFSGVPDFVLGVCVIRAAVVPVIDLGAVLGLDPARPARFVTVTIDDRIVAFAVGAVLGVRSLDDVTLREVPPLLAGLGAGTLAAIGTLDTGLLMVLGDARLVPDVVWAKLDDEARSGAADQVEQVSTP
jgi:purine-binding chemotaxis protein CheW